MPDVNKDISVTIRSNVIGLEISRKMMPIKTKQYIGSLNVQLTIHIENATQHSTKKNLAPCLKR